MVVFPNSKLNLGLHILRKRTDGFHDLETIFYPIGLNDILEIDPPPADQPDTSITTYGISINGGKESNLCLKAYEILKKDFPSMPPVQIHLFKSIPNGAGLGGGSSDASFMLKALNRRFNLELSEQQLMDYGLKLGSDCPFFIYNKPCHASGRGEILEPIDLSLKGMKVLLIHPGIHISTREAFSEIRPAIPEKPLREIIRQPIATWKDQLKNDFEQYAFTHFPTLAMIRDDLYQAGALYAAMTGSGSAIFGIFPKNENPALSIRENWFTKLLICQF